MFSFFKKPKPIVNFSNIGVDIHSHLIQGVDDGAKTVEDSITLIRGLQDVGYKKIITTPHIYKEYYPNTKDVILRGLENLKSALLEAGIDIPIEVAAEYYMDDHFESLLEEGNLLTLNQKYVLVEMSFFGAPPKLESYLFKVQLKGFTPILAHPERYLFYQKDLEALKEMRDKGILLQLNTLSPLGYYGKPIKDFSQRLLKEKMIDLIGTDMHHVGHFDYLKSNFHNKEFQQILSKYEFQNAAIFG